MSCYDLIGTVSVTERGGERGWWQSEKEREREGDNNDEDDDEGDDEEP